MGIRHAVVLPVAFLCSLGAQAARSEIITFDDARCGSGFPVAAGYGGLNWTNINCTTETGAPPYYFNSGYFNGTVSPPNVAYNPFGNTGSFSSATPFGLGSAYFTGAWNNGLTITVNGFLNGTQVDETSFVVNENTPTLETFNWNNVDQINISSSGGTKAVNAAFPGTQFVLDNLTILPMDVAPVALTTPNLPIPQPVNIPTTAFPSNPVTNLGLFQNQYRSLLPTSLNTAISQSTPMVVQGGNFKQTAGVASIGLQATADGLDLTTFHVNDASLAEIGLAGLSTVSSAIDTAFHLPSTATTDQKLASLAAITSDLAQTAISCVAAAGTAGALSYDCFASATASLLNDFIVPGLTQLARDPPDPNYKSVVTLPDSINSIRITTGDQAFNTDANKVLADIEQASAYLVALTTSANRYSTAITNGDSASAALQMTAVLRYLNLYNSAVSDSEAAIRSIQALPELQTFLQSDYNSSSFQDILQYVMQNGWSDPALNVFSDLGLDPSAVEADLLTYTPPSFTGSIDSELSNITANFSALNDTQNSVPEPSTIGLFGAALVGLFFVRKKNGAL